jgi:predicted dehydrogenase
MDKWRYHRGIIELAAIALTGEFGPVVGLRTTRIGYSHPYSDTDCIWTLLPHDLAIALEVLGQVPAPRSAVADVAGTGVMGLTAFLAADNGPWYVAEVSARSPVQQRAVMLNCRDAILLLPDSYADHVVVTMNPPPDGTKVDPRTKKLPIVEEMPLLAELKVFVEYLSGGPPPKSSVREGAQIVQAIAAIRCLAGV